MHKFPVPKDSMREQWNRSAQGWNSESPKIRGWLTEATSAMIEMASNADKFAGRASGGLHQVEYGPQERARRQGRRSNWES